MDKETLIQLTDELYRLTVLFPKKEPLRYKMREQADEILAGFISLTSELSYGEKSVGPADSASWLKPFEVLNSFFEVARLQNWVSPSRISKIQEMYLMAKESAEELVGKTLDLKPESLTLPLENLISGQEKVVSSATVRPEKLNERQKVILQLLKEQEKTQVGQLKRVFPDVSKRTLRRDFEYLLGQGLVQRLGERNNTFYRIISG